MDTLDRQIINELQRGFPVCDRPYAKVAEQFRCTENEVITRLSCMLDDGLLTRFGPLFHAERLGGALSLCAMQIPPLEFDRVTAQINAFRQVAHNYERDHSMNMWFVLATESQAELNKTLKQIEQITGYSVLNLPKEQEFFVGLHFQV